MGDAPSGDRDASYSQRIFTDSRVEVAMADELMATTAGVKRHRAGHSPPDRRTGVGGDGHRRPDGGSTGDRGALSTLGAPHKGGWPCGAH
jgi:hypothetical protein